jgi:hypothetical protein
MATPKKIDVRTAIDLLKSGGNLDKVVITDLPTSKVRAMDALLLAKNGCIVPDGNIVYDDGHVQQDPDFDDTHWGSPIPFKRLKETLLSKASEQTSETTELVVKLRVQSLDMRQWLTENNAQLNLIINGLIENMYKADRLQKP